ncbi:MAG: hypothetical protein R3Y12_08860 [Clostridia bacterium]
MTSAHLSQDVRILKKQCVSLAKAGYDTYLVAKGDSYEEDGVKIVGIGNVLGGRFKRMTVVVKNVYKQALDLDCDIYQIHDPELLPYALKLKKKVKKLFLIVMKISLTVFTKKIIYPNLQEVLYQNYAIYI